MMEIKLREALRSGKISLKVFDRDEGTPQRQSDFLKHEREQRR